MTPTLSGPLSPRFRLMHKIGAWYDAEAYFRRRAKSGRAFTMPIPTFAMCCSRENPPTSASF